jgi:hypothetical protein
MKLRIGALALLLFCCPSFGQQAAKYGNSCTALLKKHEPRTQVPSALRRTFSKLKFGDRIPDDVYLKYDSITIGRAIVEWIHQREMRPENLMADSVRLDLLQDAQLMLHFYTAQTESYAKLGFLNQHQIKPSVELATSYDPAYREKVEDEYIGLRLGTGNAAIFEQRPKSALLHLSADIDVGEFPHPVGGKGIGTYGDAIAVLTQETKFRSIFTAEESYGFGRAALMTKGQEKRLNESRGTLLRGSFPTRERTYEGPSWVEGPARSYTEALIFGKLGFEHVDHFAVIDAKSAELLQPYGKPIFLVEIVKKNRRTAREYKELLYRGEGTPTQVPRNQWNRFKDLF